VDSVDSVECRLELDLVWTVWTVWTVWSAGELDLVWTVWTVWTVWSAGVAANLTWRSSSNDRDGGGAHTAVTGAAAATVWRVKQHDFHTFASLRPHTHTHTHTHTQTHVRTRTRTQYAHTLSTATTAVTPTMTPFIPSFSFTGSATFGR
jgi:hypothetical protein